MWILTIGIVTPRAGVWIETDEVMEELTKLNVTPRAGVWIETSFPSSGSTAIRVTPRAGVWIETVPHGRLTALRWRHSPCGSVD